MRIFLTSFLLCLSVAACSANPPVRSVSQFESAMAYWCIGPDGELVREQFGADGKVTCPAPGSFVSLPICETVPPPPSDEQAWLRARALAARDGTLRGDSFERHPFCAPPKLGPPPPEL